MAMKDRGEGWGEVKCLFEVDVVLDHVTFDIVVE